MDTLTIQCVVLVLVMILLIHATRCTCKKVDTLIALREGAQARREVTSADLQAQLY